MSRVPAHIRRQALPAAIEATTALTPVLRRYPQASKALSLLLAAQAVHKAAKTLKERLTPPPSDDALERWAVTVEADDDLYEHAVTLLASQAKENWREVEAELTYRYNEVDDDERPSDRPDVKARPSSSVERYLVLGGHPIYAEIIQPRLMPITGMDQLAAGTPGRRVARAVFTAETEAGQTAVLDALRTQAVNARRQRRTRKPQYFSSKGGWGGWDRGGDLPARPVESVAVTHGQVQGVVDDILRFRSLESEYVRRGVPYHRGYLLYGPPGTGKTSAVKAIAHATDSDLYIVNLGTLDDGGLAGLVSSVSRAKNGAILLLEDIDSFGAARQREEEDEGDSTGRNAGISTTGLLNALDGVETPHGLVTIMTTNHPEFLDDALVRPGRVDKRVEFGYPDDATVERHFTYFYGRPPAVRLYAAGRSGAELNEVFVAHMTDPEAAEADLSRETSPTRERTPATPAPARPHQDPQAAQQARRVLAEIKAATPGLAVARY